MLFFWNISTTAGHGSTLSRTTDRLSAPNPVVINSVRIKNVIDTVFILTSLPYSYLFNAYFYIKISLCNLSEMFLTNEFLLLYAISLCKLRINVLWNNNISIQYSTPFLFLTFFSFICNIDIVFVLALFYWEEAKLLGWMLIINFIFFTIG